jgi:GNAT superfamily N-acetyltransferase
MSEVKIEHYTGLDHTPATAFACRAHAELLSEGGEQAVALHWSYNVILASISGKPVGVIVWFEQKETRGLWLQLGYVAPEHRKQGVYGKLWRAVVDKAREQGALFIRSATGMGNETMRAVAKSQGRRELAVSLIYDVPPASEENAETKTSG